MIYEAGFVSVENESNIVNGHKTRWTTYIKPGDEITLNNDVYIIQSVDDFNLITLTTNYTGNSLINHGYSINLTDNLVRLKENKKREIFEAYAKEIDAITSGYDETEINTWTKQETRAREYINNNNSSVPFIENMASERGLTIAEMAQKIITKADLYESAVGAILGKRQKLDAEIELATIENINNISWNN